MCVCVCTSYSTSGVCSQPLYCIRFAGMADHMGSRVKGLYGAKSVHRDICCYSPVVVLLSVCFAAAA